MINIKTECSLAEGQILNRIKQDIFYPLGEYKRDFPDFIIPELFSYCWRNKGPIFFKSIKDSLALNKEVLIYIHIPFCFSQCVFCCRFPREPDNNLQKKYVNYLLKEICLFAESGFLHKKEIKAIYLGGGNPMTLSPEDLERILLYIKRNFTVQSNCNITCETHPVSIIGLKGREELERLIKSGVNRISVGAQSFDNKVLKLCNRHHTEKDIWEAFRSAKKYNIFTNIDMLIGIPGQDIDSIENDLIQLEQLRPDAIDYMRHNVINKKALRLYKKIPDLIIDRDTLFKMNLIVKKWMQKNGFEQNGFFSENSKFFPYRYYWAGEEIPYIGFGLGARTHFGNICFDNHDKFSLYFGLIKDEKLPIGRYRILTLKEQMFRSLLLRLQTKKGLNINNFMFKFNKEPCKELKDIIGVLESYNLIIREDGHIRLSEAYGQYFAEDIATFIIDIARRKIRLHKTGPSDYTNSYTVSLAHNLTEMPKFRLIIIKAYNLIKQVLVLFVLSISRIPFLGIIIRHPISFKIDKPKKAIGKN